MLEKREILGWVTFGGRALVVHPLQVAFRGRPGVDRFRENFLPEGLVPTSAADRRLLRGASRCTSCHLCDAAGASPALPSLVPLVFARSSLDLVHARPALAALAARPEVLEEGERLCPSGVPLRLLADWLVDRLAKVDAAAGGGAP